MEAKKPTEIKFYRLEDPYGFFSNYFKSPFELDGKEWPTVEHYFQAQKHFGSPLYETIRKADSPGNAKKMARLHPMKRTDWEEVKNNVMYEGCKKKFETNAKLYEKLMNTGDAILIEHTKNDNYWADGGNGTGQNWLL